MTKQAKKQEIIKSVAPCMIQVSPYIFRVKSNSNSWVIEKLLNMVCDGTGGYTTTISDGVYRVSDPVCRELELAGCEDHTESGKLEKMQATKKTTLPVFILNGSYYR